MNPLAIILQARLAKVDLNQEFDHLFAQMLTNDATIGNEGAFKAPSTMEEQIAAHALLRKQLTSTVSYLPNWNAELLARADRIRTLLKANPSAPPMPTSPLDRPLEEVSAFIYNTRPEVAPPPIPATDTGLPFELNSDQKIALEKVDAWLKGSERFFSLRGFAGTGKSTIMRIISRWDYNFHFSAPTNKATKVLSTCIGRPCRTTYSLLGVRMEQEEDKLVLKPAYDAPYLGANPILVIDEAGTIPTVLANLIKDNTYRVLFVGDPAQLNPVGERISSVWKLATKKATLRKVERFDNSLLALSMKLRDCIKTKNWESPIKTDTNADRSEGVFVVSRTKFVDKIKHLKLEDWDNTKVCCWRNSAVNSYNNLIRENLGFKDPYEVNDRILLGAPLIEAGSFVAYTDEEFIIENVLHRDVRVKMLNGVDVVPCYHLQVGRPFSLFVPTDPSYLEALLSSIAAEASSAHPKHKREAWQVFWRAKELFSSVRYGYAMTAHRLQGTTLTNIFVDQSDILANSNKPEAFRALYVAATRPQKKLITF